MNIMMVGDIVGSPGRRAFKVVAEKMKSSGEVDFIVANAENSAAGRGLTGDLAEELFAAGADVLTLGDHVWDQKVLRPYLDQQERVIRPLNLPPDVNGRGFVSVESDYGKVTVVSLIGRVFMNPYDSPMHAIDKLLSEHDTSGIVIVDLHAEATGEKVVLGRYLDGKVSVVAGTHTHVQTSDETILPNGTAYITDLGMTGPTGGSLGRDLEQVTNMMRTGQPSPFKVAKGPAVLEGIIVDVDRTTGKAKSIKRIREFVDNPE